MTDNNPEISKLDQIVSASYKLFMRHGIRRISVEEICESASVSKMTFYKYFKNKSDLIKFIIDKIYSEQIELYRKIMKSKKTFPQKVEEIILLEHNSSKNISEEFFKDLWKNPIQEVAEQIAEFQNQLSKEVYKDFKSAQNRGEIRKDIKLDFIIYFLNNINLMLKDEKLCSMYKTPNELIMELTNFFFYGILPNADGK